MFVAQAFDDSSENSLAIVSALKRAKVPAELHIFQEGGHGFGVRETGVPADAWKERWIEWMQSQGFLDNAAIRNYAHVIAGAWQTNAHWPRFSAQLPDARLKDAYTAQRRLVRAALRQDHIAGFKGIALTENARKEFGVDQPLSGTLLRSGQLKAVDHLTVDLGNAKDIQLAPALGYVISVDISFKILNDTQAQGAVSAIAPIVELPVDYLRHLGNPSAIDAVAVNAGAGRYIVGSSKPLPGADPTAIKISLKRDGQTIQEINPATDKAASWHELRLLLNQITAQGYMLHAGDLILCSAPGKIQPAEAGKYQADFGGLGAIDFEIK
jgi:2-keto-4-pentenoate hydratase